MFLFVVIISFYDFARIAINKFMIFWYLYDEINKFVMVGVASLWCCGILFAGNFGSHLVALYKWLDGYIYLDPAALANRRTCNKSPRAEKEFVKHGSRCWLKERHIQQKISRRTEVLTAPGRGLKSQFSTYTDGFCTSLL